MDWLGVKSSLVPIPSKAAPPSATDRPRPILPPVHHRLTLKRRIDVLGSGNHVLVHSSWRNDAAVDSPANPRPQQRSDESGNQHRRKTVVASVVGVNFQRR